MRIYQKKWKKQTRMEWLDKFSILFLLTFFYFVYIIPSVIIDISFDYQYCGKMDIFLTKEGTHMNWLNKSNKSSVPVFTNWMRNPVPGIKQEKMQQGFTPSFHGKVIS